jgi:cytochrome c1
VGVVDLRHVGWYRSASELKQSLEQPQKQFKGTYMPQMNLTPAELESLVLYLELQKTPLPSSAAQVFGQICARCHGSARDPKVVVLARKPPQLSRRRVSQDTFTATLTKGRQGTAMPPWGRVMSRAFIDALFKELPP